MAKDGNGLYSLSAMARQIGGWLANQIKRAGLTQVKAD